MYRAYNRTFIVLTGGQKGVGSGALARCILETRGQSGKLILNVQNLQKNTYTVHLYLSDGDRMLAIKGFDITVDAKGKGEGKYEFDPDDIGGSGLALEQLAVITINAGTDFSKPALIGFFGEELTDWHKKSVIFSNEKPPEIKELIEIEASEKPEEIVEEPIEESVEEPEEEACDIHEEFSALAKKFNAEIEALNDLSNMSEEELMVFAHEKFGGADLPQKGETYKKLFRKEFIIKPFVKDKEDIEWVRIQIEDLPEIIKDSEEFTNRDLVLENYQKYKHMLLGRYTYLDSSFYIIGVPDLYRADRKSEAARQGFRQFKPCESEFLINGILGYWIAVFDEKRMLK